MSVRSFPETRHEPEKRILLIPVILIGVGVTLMYLHESLRFIGILLSLTGVLTVFLVGVVFADIWAASHRTQDIIRAREQLQRELQAEHESDPFLDTLDEPDSE